jgi:hypothetical protein
MTESPRPLAPREVARLLESAAAAIRAEFAALTDDVLAWHPAAGEWCAKEVLGHLIESERRGFAGRIRLILSGDEPGLEAWDQGEVARARRDCERPASVLIAELERGGRHPKVGHLRVADLLHEWVHHDRNHMRQLLANIQAAAWPHMGNARRFTTG